MDVRPRTGPHSRHAAVLRAAVWQNTMAAGVLVGWVDACPDAHWLAGPPSASQGLEFHAGLRCPLSHLEEGYWLLWAMAVTAANWRNGQGQDCYGRPGEGSFKIPEPPWRAPDREKTSTSAFDPERTVNTRRHWAMVNDGVVNGTAPYFPPAAFCESFRVFGRIPRFQNPVKYICGFEINRNMEHPRPATAPIWRNFPFIINAEYVLLRIWKGASPIMAT